MPFISKLTRVALVAVQLFAICPVLVFPRQAAAGPFDSSPAWIQFGTSGSHYGRSAAVVGDVNGDGYDDVVVGANFYGNGHVDEGGAWLYLGSAAGPDTAADWHVEGNQTNAQLGYLVSGAGDVNSDGYADVIVGIPPANRVHAYYGSPTGLNPFPSWNVAGCCAFGFSAKGAGDVNGDGFDDVIIGAWQGADGELLEGLAYVYLGSATGLRPTPVWTGQGNLPSAWYGWSVSGAGDVNGDGFDDVIVGATKYTNGETEEGRAFVYHGMATGVESSPAWTAESNQPSTFFGFSVAGAGDVNGDSFDDVIVGVSGWSQGDGLVSVYPGSPSGLAAEPLFTTHGNQGNQSELGWTVDTAGDLNQDGYDDILIGEPHAANPEGYEGAVRVYVGSPTGPAEPPAQTLESNHFEAHLGQAVSSAGDVNGDLYLDLLAGAPMSHCPLWPCGPIPAYSVIYLGVPTGLDVPEAGTSASGIRLVSASPNPFVHWTSIGYSLDVTSSVELRIFDAAGRLVASLVEGQRPKGSHIARWNGTDGDGRPLPQGIYFARLASGSGVLVEKVVRLR
jgi:FlgD Ig-like domain/FG-GAP repeat